MDFEKAYNNLLRDIEIAIKGSTNKDTINSKWFREHVYPKPYWRPSDEQINALRRAFNTGSIGFSDMEKLATLYEDIKIEIL